MLWIVYKSNRVYDKQSELSFDEINLQGLFYWNIPYNDLNNDIKALWEDTVRKVKNRDFKNFMKLSETAVAHIRPKANNSSDTTTITNGIVAPKKTYWLNSKYVAG
ncbi:MAG: hypothetical protein ACK5NF_06570 [Bacilli bacterium]